MITLWMEYFLNQFGGFQFAKKFNFLLNVFLLNIKFTKTTSKL